MQANPRLLCHIGQCSAIARGCDCKGTSVSLRPEPRVHDCHEYPGNQAGIRESPLCSLALTSDPFGHEVLFRAVLDFGRHCHTPVLYKFRGGIYRGQSSPALSHLLKLAYWHMRTGIPRFRSIWLYRD
jgi:hypothetical protein